MPMKLAKPCKHPGCARTTRFRFCDQHGKRHSRQLSRQRLSPSKRGYGRDWQRTRELVLAEEPFCRECERKGWIRPATEVDHIRPLLRGGTHDRSNLRPLCAACHSRKTVKSDGGFGRKTQARIWDSKVT
jgi:5-methylcytosine-specific restriction enzyme A